MHPNDEEVERNRVYQAADRVGLAIRAYGLFDDYVIVDEKLRKKVGKLLNTKQVMRLIDEMEHDHRQMAPLLLHRWPKLLNTRERNFLRDIARQRKLSDKQARWFADIRAGVDAARQK
jgi:hypothetical protein